MNLCYVLDSWPNLSETFVRRELSIAARHHDVSIVALERTGEIVDDAETRTLDSRVTFLSEGRCKTGWAFRSVGLRPIRFARAAAAARRGRVEGTQRRFPDLLRTAAMLRRRRVDRIHAHFARWSTAAAEVLSAWTGAPFGFTAHAYDLFDGPVRFAQKARSASWIVTCSEYGGTEARRLAGDAATKVSTIRHGLELAIWKPSTAPRSPGPFRILAIGRLLALKGFDVLVRSVAELRERGIEAELRIIGGGDEAKALESLVEASGLADRVRLDGPRSSDEVRAALTDWADVLAVPSRHDRLPNTIAEAFACGRPVVATTVGAIGELVEHQVTGLLVPPDDVGALTDALASLAGDAATRHRLGANGRTRVEVIFDGEKNVAALLDVIESAGRSTAR